MTEQRAVFNIGSQQAGAISNVGGDQTIHQQHATYTAAPLQTLGDLRAAVDATALPAPARAAATEALDDAAGELATSEPDRGRVADRLEHLAQVLGHAGALTASATQLLGPLRALAGWLGPAGGQLLQVLR